MPHATSFTQDRSLSVVQQPRDDEKQTASYVTTTATASAPNNSHTSTNESAASATRRSSWFNLFTSWNLLRNLFSAQHRNLDGLSDKHRSSSSSSLVTTGDIDTAELASLRLQAEGGDADAQFDLSRALALRKRFEESMLWLRRSAHQAHLFAMLTLGETLMAGHLEQAIELETAIDWLRKCAVRRFVPAMVMLSEALMKQLDRTGVMMSGP
jgi:TPR repeat protein